MRTARRDHSHHHPWQLHAGAPLEDHAGAPVQGTERRGDQAEWFNPPETWGKDEHHMDFRVGGIETSVGGPPGGAVHTFRAIYQDIVPNERIIYTYDMHLDDVRISVSLTSFEIKPDGDHTILLMTEHGAFLDGFADGNDIRRDGTSQLLDQLGAFLAREGAN
jgi:uncharacterized protein YndB with AHSA1/START domain